MDFTQIFAAAQAMQLSEQDSALLASLEAQAQKNIRAKGLDADRDFHIQEQE